MSSSKHIAIFAFEYRELNTYPSITNPAILLAKEGFIVDLYLPSHMYSTLDFPGIEIHTVSGNDRYNYITNTVKAVRGKTYSYSFCIAYYMEGLIIAEILNRSQYLPTAYFSMELLYDNLLSKMLKRFTIRSGQTKLWFLQLISWIRLQLQGHTFIPFSIIQDKYRGQFLKKEFKFIDKMYYVPNSYIGFNSKKSDFAYKRFQIPHRKKILLYTGAMERGFDVGLYESIKTLPDDYVLLCNVFSRDNYVKELMETYGEQIKQQKIIFSTENLDDPMYDELVRSSHIGIAWYGNPGKLDHNMYYLGISSGKLCKYLACGIPVIAPDYFYKYDQLIDANGIGITCHDASKIGEAITSIEKDYAQYQNQVKQFYISQVEFENCFRSVIHEISKVAR